MGCSVSKHAFVWFCLECREYASRSTEILAEREAREHAKHEAFRVPHPVIVAQAIT